MMLYGNATHNQKNKGANRMSNYPQEIKGLSLLYYMMKRFKMTYAEAIEEMERRNQDMTFIVEMGIDKDYIINNKNNINLNNKGGQDVE